MRASDLRYPVVALTPDGDFMTYGTSDDLQTTYAKFLKRAHWYVGWRITDSSGKTYEIQGVRQHGRVGPLFTKWLLTLGPRIRVELELTPAAKPESAEQWHSRVMRELATSPTRQSRADIDDFRRAMAGARTMPEILGVLAKYDR